MTRDMYPPTSPARGIDGEPPRHRAPDRYVIEVPGRGFTESFNQRQIETLVTLGLIVHDYDDHVLVDGNGTGIGPLHHFYRKAP